jgi:hypothetical protein
MKKTILVTANDFASSKTNPGQSPKHHFCCEREWNTLSISGAAWREAFKQAELSVVAAHAIPRQLLICYMLRAALKFVALIVKILSCNKNIFFHGLRWKLLQLFYFSGLSSNWTKDRTPTPTK